MNEEVPKIPEPKKTNHTFAIIGIVLLGVVGILLLKNATGTSKPPAMQVTPATQQESIETTEEVMTEPTGSANPAVGTLDTKMTDTAETQTIQMDMASFYYSPASITVKKGQKVRIELTSKDMMHDFNIDQLGVKSPIVKAGDTATVEFVADQVGKFEYYCSVGQHRKNGQVGMLIVEE